MYRLYCILSAVSIIMINQKQNKGKQNIGSFLLLPAYGRVGQGQHFLAAYFAKRNTKNCGGETPVVERFAFTTGQEARAGREFIFPTPLFLPAPPERNFQKSASGFCLKKVRILSKRYRQSVKVLSGSPATRARHPILNAKLNFLSLFHETERQKRAFLNF